MFVGLEITTRSFVDLLKEIRNVTPLRKDLSEVKMSLAGFPIKQFSWELATRAFLAATSSARQSVPSILAGSSS